MKNRFPVIDMRVFIKEINAIGVELRCPAFDAVYLVSLLDQKFVQMPTILTRHARYQCFLHYSLQIRLHEC